MLKKGAFLLAAGIASWATAQGAWAQTVCEQRDRAQELRIDLRSADALAALRELEARASSGVDSAAIRLDRAAVLLDLWRVPDALDEIDAASTALASQEAPGSDACGAPPSEGPIRVLELRARAARVAGAFAEAATEWDAALLSRRAQPPGPSVLARSLCLAAEAHWLAGHLDTMERLYAEAKEIAEALVPADDMLRARIFLGVGWMAAGRGDLAGAETAYGRSLELYRAARGDAHPAVAGVWISLGSLAAERDDLLTAAAMYEKARVILEPLSDPSVASDQAALRLNLGSVDARLGLVDSARAHFEAARLIWAATRGPDHPHHAWVAEELATLLEESGRLEEAEAVQADAVRLRDRSMPGSPSAVLTRARLAVLRARAGLAAESRGLWVEIDAAAAQLATAGTLFQATLATRRAETSEALGELAIAAQQRSLVLALLSAQLPKGHPGLVDARIQVARADWLAGRRRQALRQATDTLRVQRRVVADTIRTLPESTALRFAERTRDVRDLVLCAAAVLPSTASSTDELMGELAASRALIAGALHARGDEDESRGALSDARRRYATLLWQPIASADEGYATRLASAREELERLERSAARRGAAPPAPAEKAASAAAYALGPRDALVAFGRYRCPSAGGAGRGGYVAFVRTPSGPARVVRFADGAALDRAVAAWHDAIGGAVHAPPTEAQEELVAARGRTLAKMLWSPLAAAIGTAQRVFIVPDGALHLVSWYALPGARLPYLVDEPRILHVLTAESDLRAASSSGAPGQRGVVILADPMVVRASTAVADAALGAEVRHLRSACSFVDPKRLPRLAQSLAEATDLELQARSAGRPVDIATGASASEGWLRDHAPRAGILHLAVHGGVLSPESCREPTASTDEPTNARVRSLWAEAVRSRPLMRSGLLLTGAAGFTPLDAPGTDDDGVLVAEEAARLDLRGADWVVLSACSTRRGPVVDAEGALGLHRAFHSAGARTVIASLWDVQDAPARRFMSALYDARLREGRSTADALRQAERAVLGELRASGRSTHPVQWAAFVASGDWR